MKSPNILILIFILSCNKPIDVKKELIFYEIPYGLELNYLDSIAKKITPNKNYDYWQFVSYREQYTYQKNTSYSILAEGGNLNLKEKINTNIDPIKLYGLFEGGHPAYRCNYLVVIENEIQEYIESMERLRDFIGNIDNLEEALLYAKTYGFVLGIKPQAKKFHYSNDVYILHLVKYNDSYPNTTFKLRGELVEVHISKDGFMKTKTLGLYCEGNDCLIW